MASCGYMGVRSCDFGRRSETVAITWPIPFDGKVYDIPGHHYSSGSMDDYVSRGPRMGRYSQGGRRKGWDCLDNVVYDGTDGRT